MTAIGTALRGFGKVAGSPGLVLWLWIVNVAMALPAAAVLTESIRDSVGTSLVHQNLRDGFDMGWYGEYSAEARGIESTFTPTVTGAGAFFNNIEAWFNGDIFETYRGLLGLGILYAIMWTFFLGGILQRYGEGAGLFRLNEFFAEGASYFFRFLRLAVISGFFYYLVYRFAAWLFVRMETSTRDVTSEESVFAYVLAGSLLVVFLLTFVNMAFDFAKIATYRENRRSMVLATLKGFGFVLSNLGKTTTLYYGLGLAGVLMLLIYNFIAPGVGQSSASVVAMAFLIGQAYLVAKLVLRLTFYASEIALFDGVRNY